MSDTFCFCYQPYIYIIAPTTIVVRMRTNFHVWMKLKQLKLPSQRRFWIGVAEYYVRSFCFMH